MTDFEARMNSIPDEIEATRLALGAFVVDGDAKAAAEAEKKISQLESERARLDLAAAEKARREDEARLKAEAAEQLRREAEVTGLLDAVRKQAEQVDKRLDALFAELGKFETAIDAALDKAQAYDFDVRDLTSSVWCGSVHERLLQDAGIFSRYLRTVPNGMSSWSTPIAEWVPTLDSIRRRDRHKVRVA